MPVNSRLAKLARGAKDLVYVTHGDGTALAVVMAPVMPTWDEGAFFAPITERLVALGYRVMIFDSLSLQPAHHDLDTYASAWRRVLQRLGPIHLLAGSALGGALVQSLLDTRWAAQIPLTLLISAPTKADTQLDQRLGQMAKLAAASELPQALRWLDYWIAPDTSTTALLPPALHAPVARPPAAQRPDLQTQGYPLSKPPYPALDNAHIQACARLARGFGLLQGLDVGDAVKPYPGKLLSVYGEQSQLVRASNISFLRTERHLAVSIPGSGMRPHIEQPAQVWACVQEHLHLTAHIAP